MRVEGNPITYKISREISESLSYFVDFGQDEGVLLRNLWQSKVEHMLKNLYNPKQEEEEFLSCDGPKYWVEEAQQLAISELDPKIMKLNELIEDIEDAIKASRMCSSREYLEEVLKFA